MSDEEVDRKIPESAIMKTLRLLRFPALGTAPPADDDPSSPSPQGREDTWCSSGPPSPPPKPTRTPMGNYIIPPGEGPLTSLGYPAPGPSDYMPKIDLTRKSAPHYSLVGKAKKIPSKKNPGPADYTCGKDLTWHDRTITLKARVKSSYFKDDTVPASDIGPAKYNTEIAMGSESPRFSIATKHACLDVMAGPPCTQVQPVDTHGFETPGPNYRPNSSYWGRGPRKSFGTKEPDVIETPIPGPGDYDIPDPDKGPSYSLSKRLKNRDEVKRARNRKDPAPNTYDVGSTIGKAVAISMSSRRKAGTKVRRLAPAPNTYTLKNTIDTQYKAATMAYRWFDTKEDGSPGPTDYHVRHVTLKKDPEFTCRQTCKPSYPDSLHYVTKSSPTSSPGPGKYNISSNIRNNDNPAFSVGSPNRRYRESGPAPNQYSVEKFTKPGAVRAPAFTMGRRFESPDSKVSPGPAAYNLQKRESGGPKYTMSRRLKCAITAASNPGPNSYKLSSCQTNRGLNKNGGIKLKSRASPYVYSGFQTKNIVEP